MTGYKAVIFDFDGTLADTSEGIFNSIRYVERMLNFPLSSDKQKMSHIGPPIEEAYSKTFGIKGDLLQQAILYHKQYSLEKGMYELSFYPGIKDILVYFHDREIKVGIATLKIEDTMKKIIELNNIQKYFDTVVGIQPNSPSSKKDVIMRCISHLGCNIGDCLLVGDSVFDAIGAMEVGIDFIGVTYGFGFKKVEEMGSYKYIGCAKNPDELLQILRDIFM